jgi:hypothetical protein
MEHFVNKTLTNVRRIRAPMAELASMGSIRSDVDVSLDLPALCVKPISMNALLNRVVTVAHAWTE